MAPLPPIPAMSLRVAGDRWPPGGLQHPLAARRATVITLTDLEWAGRGWRSTGDAVWILPAVREPASTSALLAKKYLWLTEKEDPAP
jgi:hypothetical protein